AKKERPGKIFVDYFRNGHGNTAVAPYSVRARPGAPVALPLSWSEVKNLRSAASFSLRQATERMQRPDPWQGFELVAQKLPLLGHKARSQRQAA
ncbi:MAG: non-homologous end-joining DNA ligase LigD, partial [Bdellovibrionota bacterium]